MSFLKSDWEPQPLSWPTCFTGTILSISIPVNTPKFSVVGANETLCCLVHRRLCQLSPAADLAEHSNTLAQLRDADLRAILGTIFEPAVQSSDVRGIMAMRAPSPAQEQAIPEAKSSPGGLGCVADMDHRLGAWK